MTEWMDCPSCNGTKTEFPDCDVCGGRGWVYDLSDGVIKPCLECDNKPCSKCGGYGIVEQNLDDDEFASWNDEPGYW